MQLTRATRLVLTGASLGLLTTPWLAHHVPSGGAATTAGDYVCVVVRDGHGRPINTTCVPWPFG